MFMGARVKLIDLDSVRGMRYVHRKRPELLGTYTYRSRDYYLASARERQSLSSDIFSVGIMILEVYMQQTMASLTKQGSGRYRRLRCEELLSLLNKSIRDFVQLEVRPFLMKMLSPNTGLRPRIGDVIAMFKSVELNRPMPVV